jgi:hypothetical protein
VQGGVEEAGGFHFALVKRREIEDAVIETDCEIDLFAMLEMKPKHFTIFKYCITEGCGAQFGHGQVAAGKTAFGKSDA